MNEQLNPGDFESTITARHIRYRPVIKRSSLANLSAEAKQTYDEFSSPSGAYVPFCETLKGITNSMINRFAPRTRKTDSSELSLEYIFSSEAMGLV